MLFCTLICQVNIKKTFIFNLLCFDLFSWTPAVISVFDFFKVQTSLGMAEASVLETTPHPLPTNQGYMYFEIEMSQKETDPMIW